MPNTETKAEQLLQEIGSFPENYGLVSLFREFVNPDDPLKVFEYRYDFFSGVLGQCRDLMANHWLWLQRSQTSEGIKLFLFGMTDKENFSHHLGDLQRFGESDLQDCCQCDFRALANFHTRIAATNKGFRLVPRLRIMPPEFDPTRPRDVVSLDYLTKMVTRFKELYQPPTSETPTPTPE